MKISISIGPFLIILLRTSLKIPINLEDIDINMAILVNNDIGKGFLKNIGKILYRLGFGRSNITSSDLMR